MRAGGKLPRKCRRRAEGHGGKEGEVDGGEGGDGEGEGGEGTTDKKRSQIHLTPVIATSLLHPVCSFFNQ